MKLTVKGAKEDMRGKTAQLARSITKASSKQSYYTALLLADKDLADDCMKAYAYFRWVDDVVDEISRTRDERVAFIERQKVLIEALYNKQPVNGLIMEEQLIADLIESDDGGNSGLQSFIRNFFAVIEFDAHRKERLISQEELEWYASTLGKSVTDAIQYFVCNEHPYPDSKHRYCAATAAHITHMLRDMVSDVPQGFINIPHEYIEEYALDLEDVSSPAFRSWVRDRVRLARDMFAKGKGYLDELYVLRCKIAGYWYCARFECILDIIEKDGYVLRSDYSQRRKWTNWLRIAGLAVSITARHFMSSLTVGGKVCRGRKIYDREIV